MNLKIVSAGRSLVTHEQAWIDDYVLRTKKFARLTLVRIKERSRSTPSETALATWEEMKEHFTPSSFRVVLESSGKPYSTEEFKNLFTKLEREAYKELIFVIGGAYGLPEIARKEANLSLSLSKFTFPHRLALLILTEQIYRVLSWKAGSPYHHE